MASLPRMNGYSKLASMMGSNAELAIFRRFGKLNAQNLLYLQAELIHLEHKMERSATEGAESGHEDRRLYDRDWLSLSESGIRAGGAPQQWETALLIRTKLKEYNEALVIQMLLAKQNSPHSRDLHFLKEWMRRPSMGFVYLLGMDSDVSKQIDQSCLLPCSIKVEAWPPGSSGTFVYEYYIGAAEGRSLTHSKLATQDIYANTIHYSDQTLHRVGEVIGIGTGRRLATIAAFTTFFSGILGVFLNSRAIEIFAATAGFAAVQVVFVGTTSDPSQA